MTFKGTKICRKTAEFGGAIPLGQTEIREQTDLCFMDGDKCL